MTKYHPHHPEYVCVKNPANEWDTGLHITYDNLLALVKGDATVSNIQRTMLFDFTVSLM